jgi:hypothetical protein
VARHDPGGLYSYQKPADGSAQSGHRGCPTRRARRVGLYWQLKPRLGRGFFATRALIEKRVPPMRREGGGGGGFGGLGGGGFGGLGGSMRTNPFPVMAAPASAASDLTILHRRGPPISQ